MAESTSPYTLEEAKEMLALWKECYRALASGQVKSYKIGSRELTNLDLKEVRECIAEFNGIIQELSGNVRNTRSACVVFRDL